MEGARQYRESNMTYTLYILGEELSHMYPISCNWGNVLYVVSFDMYSKYMYMCSMWFVCYSSLHVFVTLLHGCFRVKYSLHSYLALPVLTFNLPYCPEQAPMGIHSSSAKI